VSSPPKDGRPETEEPMVGTQSTDCDHRFDACSSATLQFYAVKARPSSEPSARMIYGLKSEAPSAGCSRRAEVFKLEASTTDRCGKRKAVVCGLTFELSGRHRIGAWPAKRMMTLAGSRAKCQAGGGPLERRVRRRLGTAALVTWHHGFATETGAPSIVLHPFACASAALIASVYNTGGPLQR
jgi:hypothetical protein